MTILHGSTLSDYITLVDCGDVEGIRGNAARTFEATERALDEFYAAGGFPVGSRDAGPGPGGSGGGADQGARLPRGTCASAGPKGSDV